MEISAVDRGVVSLFGVHSRRFVAMNRRGRLYGTVGALTVLTSVLRLWACLCTEHVSLYSFLVTPSVHGKNMNIVK